MRIGITTFTWDENYGAVLQAHALQRFLQDLGHEVAIVNPLFPASGLAIGSLNGLNPKSKFLAFIHSFSERCPSLRVVRWGSILQDHAPPRILPSESAS